MQILRGLKPRLVKLAFWSEGAPLAFLSTTPFFEEAGKVNNMKKTNAWRIRFALLEIQDTEIVIDDTLFSIIDFINCFGKFNAQKISTEWTQMNAERMCRFNAF